MGDVVLELAGSREVDRGGGSSVRKRGRREGRRAVRAESMSCEGGLSVGWSLVGEEAQREGVRALDGSRGGGETYCILPILILPRNTSRKTSRYETSYQLRICGRDV